MVQVVRIGQTAIGIGVRCDDPKCEWDSVPYMQNNYTSGHRRLLLDCLGVEDQSFQPSQQHTQVTIVQRLLTRGRSLLNVLEMQDAVAQTGAQVQIVNMEGVLCSYTCLPAPPPSLPLLSYLHQRLCEACNSQLSASMLLLKLLSSVV